MVQRPVLILLFDFLMLTTLQTLLPLLVTVVCALIGWTWIDCARRSKIRLYHVPLTTAESENKKSSLGTCDSLARLVRDKVPSLGRKDAKLSGVWWLPGYSEISFGLFFPLVLTILL